jgi:hypothetical protein
MHLPGRLRLVRLPHQYRGAHRRSLPQWPRARSPQARPDWSAGRPRAPALSHGMHGISQVPGQPLCARPALGPRGGRRAQPSQRADAADTFQTAPAHPNLSFRGSITRLSHSLSTLRGPDHPGSRARLASGWWLACAGQMLPLLGRSGRFPCHGSSATFPPPPGFAWRDRNDKGWSTAAPRNDKGWSTAAPARNDKGWSAEAPRNDGLVLRMTGPSAAPGTPCPSCGPGASGCGR